MECDGLLGPIEFGFRGGGMGSEALWGVFSRAWRDLGNINSQRLKRTGDLRLLCQTSRLNTLAPKKVYLKALYIYTYIYVL